LFFCRPASLFTRPYPYPEQLPSAFGLYGPPHRYAKQGGGASPRGLAEPRPLLPLVRHSLGNGGPPSSPFPLQNVKDHVLYGQCRYYITQGGQRKSKNAINDKTASFRELLSRAPGKARDRHAMNVGTGTLLAHASLGGKIPAASCQLHLFSWPYVCFTGSFKVTAQVGTSRHKR
jgi:hypothetical protein